MERRLHSRAVGENKTPGALLLFLHVHLVIWRHGVPRRTKSQGQISWHCRGNSWEEQTRKSLHFIKDPAGEQQSFSSSPPTLTITLFLPSVCHYTHTIHTFPHRFSVALHGNMNCSINSNFKQETIKHTSFYVLALYLPADLKLFLLFVVKCFMSTC